MRLPRRSPEAGKEAGATKLDRKSGDPSGGAQADPGEHSMQGSTRQAIRAGYQILTENPALILWYLKSRVRNAALPLERAFGDGRSLAPRFVTLKPTLRCNLRCEFCRFVANGDVFGK